MTLREFYDSCINEGANGESLVVVEMCDVIGFHDSSTKLVDDKFIINPKLNIGGDPSNMSYTLDKLYEECKKRGCKDDTPIGITYCNVSTPKIDTEYNLIYID